VKDSIQELEALAEKLNTSLANQANRSLIEIKATVLAQINNLAKALESMKAYRNSIDRVDAASRKKFEDLFQKEQGSLNGWKKVTEDEISNKLKKFESTLNEKAKHLDSSSHLSVQLQQQSKKCSELEEKVSTLERLVAALIHGKITNVAQVAVKDGTSVRDNQRRGKLSEEIDVILGLN
jgi:predicted RNase H-like nuclease (RuvC/YqgF family)